MRFLLAGAVAVVAFVASASVSSASIVIDNFTDAVVTPPNSTFTSAFSPINGTGLSGTVTRQHSTNSAGLKIGGGSVIGSEMDANNSFRLTYFFATAQDFHSIYKTFRLDFSGALTSDSLYRVGVQISDGVSTYNFATQLLTGVNDASLFFNTGAVGNGALASNVTRMFVNIERRSTIPGTFDSSIAVTGLVATPEPSSVVGASILGLAGFAYRRRKNRKQV